MITPLMRKKAKSLAVVLVSIVAILGCQKQAHVQAPDAAESADSAAQAAQAATDAAYAAIPPETTVSTAAATANNAELSAPVVTKSAS